jgi:hypothetical protein
VRGDLEEKTVDLAEVSGGPVDEERLAMCIRKGFEQAWGIVFTTGATHEIDGGRQ